MGEDDAKASVGLTQRATAACTASIIYCPNLHQRPKKISFSGKSSPILNETSHTMPVTTRNQVDAQGVTDEDMISPENRPEPDDTAEEAKGQGSTDLDETVSYHPVFCLSNNIPEEVRQCPPLITVNPQPTRNRNNSQA